MTMLDERIEEMLPAPPRRPRWLVLVLVAVLLAGVTLYVGYSHVQGADFTVGVVMAAAARISLV